LCEGAADEHQGEVVVGRDGGDAAVTADQGDHPVDRKVLPEGVEGVLQDGFFVVPGRVDGACHRGVVAVSADHDPGVFDHLGAAVGVAADADHGAVVEDQLVDGERLPDLGAGLGGRVHQHLVEHAATRRESESAAVHRTRATRHHDRPEVEGEPPDWRAAARRHLFQQAPSSQRRHPVGLDDQRGQRVAREGGPVDEKDPVALAGKEHGGRGAGAAGPHDDGVIGGGHGGQCRGHGVWQAFGAPFGTRGALPA
jgi:hypothetical protein